MMNLQKTLSLITSVYETLFFSGVAFGWSSLQPILTELGYFGQNCSQEMALNSTMETALCPSQVERFSLVFSISSGAPALCVWIIGYIYDRFGGWFTRTLFITLLLLGFLLIAASTIATSWMLFVAMTFLSIGGNALLMTNIQASNIFPVQHRATVVAVISGAFDASTVVFLIVNAVYNTGVEFHVIFYTLAAACALLHFRTFFLTPIYFAPKVLPDDYKYGYNGYECCEDEVTEEQIVKKEETEVDGEETAELRDWLTDALVWTNLLHYVITSFRVTFFVGSFNSWIETIVNDDQDSRENFVFVFGVILSLSGLSAPICGLLIGFYQEKYSKQLPQRFASLKALNVGFILTDVLLLLFSVCVLIPIAKLQYFAIALHSVGRAFVFSVNCSFANVYYPVPLFGRLYSLPIAASGLSFLLQYPLTVLVQRTLNNNFTYVNAILLLLSLLACVHPYAIYRRLRRIEGD